MLTKQKRFDTIKAKEEFALKLRREPKSIERGEIDMKRIGRGCLNRHTKCTLHILSVICIVCAVSMTLCSCGVVNDSEKALSGDDTGQTEDQVKQPEGNAGASGEEMGSAEGDTGVEESQQISDFVSGTEIIPGRQDYHLDAFGGNVFFFASEDDPEEVQGILEEIWKKQETNQFGDDRYAIYFLPGTYDEKIQAKVGFYTQIAGLGTSPDDVSLYNLTCDARWLGDDNNHNATCNFWRGVENLSVREDTTWAVSQATFMRRMHIGKKIYLHDDYGWASGGFLADSKVELAVDSGSQQQWLSRNCDWSIWVGENWNMVFAGIEEGGNLAGARLYRCTGGGLHQGKTLFGIR